MLRNPKRLAARAAHQGPLWPPGGLALRSGVSWIVVNEPLKDVVRLGKTGPIPRGALWGVGIGDCYGMSAIYGGAEHREDSGGGVAFIGVRFPDGRRYWRRGIGEGGLWEVHPYSSDEGFPRLG